MKVAIITCSPQNDYPRARSLRAAFKTCPDARVSIVRNSHIGRLRYLEMMLKICRTRLFIRPDVYVITFRGFETLFFMKLTLVRKPIVFDELINFTEWMEEQGRLKRGSRPYRLFRRWYAWLAGRCRIVLADTGAHAKYSAMLNMLSIDQYRVIPVVADETIFQPGAVPASSNKPFTVLYYGHMLPLHGLEYVLDAAVLLKDREDIVFRLVGGKKQGEVARACAAAVEAGAHVTHENWLPFEELPAAIRGAGLTLGGPFGGTLQAGFVVTGKTYQALACAAPVLIGRNEASEGFTDKKNCLMVTQADPRALTEAITWAHEHPGELRKIGKAGRRLYENNFSQAHVNSLVADIVEELRWS